MAARKRIGMPAGLPPIVRPDGVAIAAFPRTPNGMRLDASNPAAGLPLVPVYDPPVVKAAPPAPPIVADGVGDGYESASRTVVCGDIPAATSGWLPIYSTARRWAGADVWVSTDFFPTAPALGIGWLSFALVAVSRGVRTVVATGRLRGNASNTPGPAQRVCGARVVADRFEVYAARNGSPADAAMVANVSIIASDEATTPAYDGAGGLPFGVDGVIPVASADGALSATSPQIMPAQGNIPYTPVLVHAWNNTAATERLTFQFGALNLAQWAIPAGQSLILSDPAMLRRLSSSSAQQIVSSAAGVLFRWYVR